MRKVASQDVSMQILSANAAGVAEIELTTYAGKSHPKSSAHMTSRFLPAKIRPFPAHKSTNGMTTPSRSRRAACSRVADSASPSGRRNGKIGTKMLTVFRSHRPWEASAGMCRSNRTTR